MWWLQEAVRRWQQPSLQRHLADDERILVATRAFTGLLAHPLLVSGPMWASTLWEVCLTDRRLVAVQRHLLPWPHREARIISIPRSEIRRLTISWDWGIQANVKIETPEKTREFKVWGFPRETFDFTSQMRRLATELPHLTADA